MKSIGSDSIFSVEIRQNISEEINKNDGNEVFFHAFLDKQGNITGIEALAWGNESSAPALLRQLKPGDAVIHNHPSGDLTPSYADVQIASYVGNQGIGFYIINNEVSSLKVVVDRYVIKEKEYISANNIADELNEDSAVAKALPGYECRQGQIDMASETARSFNDGMISLIEAGTGTGKTLAYMIPAIKWAIKNKERVLVSTKTINLQEQLAFKDLPLLKEVLEEDFSAVLVKGRNNYVCLRKTDAEERDLGLFSQEEADSGTEELKTIISWSKKTSDGSLSDLSFIPSYEVWDKVKCESDTCPGIKCTFYESCFLVSARRAASLADILIVNHHLLFADLSLRGSSGSLSDVSVLPPYTRIIIDEAHHVEDISTDFFGSTVSQFWLKRQFGRLRSADRKGRQKGLLPTVLKKLRYVKSKKYSVEISSITNLIEQELFTFLDGLTQYSEDMFAEIAIFLQKNINNRSDEHQYLLDERFLSNSEWENLVLVKTEGFVARIRGFKNKLQGMLDSLKELGSEIIKEIDNTIIEIDAQARRLGTTADSLYYLMFDDDKSMVKWIVLTEKQKNIKICAAPIEVAEDLKRSLFDPFDTVIMTSATLTVGNDFDFIRSRLGIDLIDRDRVLNRIFPSPFDFKKQVVIGIPLNIDSPDHPRFQSQSQQLISKSIGISEGRAFVLFTSYFAMGEAFDSVSDSGIHPNIKMLKQGTETRHNLLNRFRNEQPSALFATDSFWEGVDVIGSALESIIIARLPFKVPTVPIEIARREAIDMEGGNSFTDYTVPQAVIKFKQGFGRLIRHKSDRGTILILDNRIINKMYGRLFIDSLPECNVVADTDETVFEAFRQFYHK